MTAKPIPGLPQVLQVSNVADGKKITDLLAGTDPTDAANVSQITNSWGKIYNVVDYGAVGDKSHDDTAAINAAIAAIRADLYRLPGGIGGQTLYFPPGWYKVTSTIDLSSRVGTEMGDIRVVGSGGSYTTLSRMGSQIFYSGPAAGPVIDMTGCRGVIWQGVSVQAETATFTGKVIDLDNPSTNNNMEGNQFRDLQLSIADGAAGCILMAASGSVFLHCYNVCFATCANGSQFRGGKTGGSYSVFANANGFFGCVFQSTRTNSVLDPCSQTTFVSCTFEQSVGGTAAPVKSSTVLTYPAEVISFHGCGFWDVSAGSTPWLHATVATNTWGLFGCYATLSPTGVFADLSNHTGLIVHGCHFNAASGTPNIFTPAQNITNGSLLGCKVTSPVVDNHASVFV